MNISLTPIKSSNIAAVGYDSQEKTLIVKFNRGDVYQYHDVPKDVYLGLMNAPSPGQYFHKAIKNRYTEEEL